EGEGVRLTLTFMTPALPEDVEILSRPVTYVTWEVRALDGKSHSFQSYFDANAEIAVNQSGEHISFDKAGGESSLTSYVGVATVDQPVLQKKGDDLRIDWGHFIVATANSVPGSARIVPPDFARSLFATNG